MSQCIRITSEDLRSLNIVPQSYKCGVCWQTADKVNNWFYHNDEQGKKHPLHRDCIDYVVATGGCPFCRVKVDLSSILSLREKWSNLTRQIAVDIFIRSVKFFPVALIASKVVDVVSSNIINTTPGSIGTAMLGLSTGLFGTANLLNTILVREHSSNIVKIISGTIGAFIIPMAFDLSTASGDSYGFYGACVLPIIVYPIAFIGYLGYRRIVH